MTTVSIVIPTRNRLHFLQEAIASIRQQTFQDYELFVVDDASDDETWEWLSAQEVDRMRPIRHAQRSERSRSRNDGLAQSTGRYVLFLDDDDRLRPTALRDLVTALEEHPHAVAAVGGFEQFNERGDRRKGTHVKSRRVWFAWRDALFHWVANPSRTLFRRDVIASLGGFRLGAHQGFEDWDAWLRVTKIGPIVLVPDVVLEYRIHAGQQFTGHERQVMADLAKEYAASLIGDDRNTAERIQSAREAWLEANSALTGFAAGRALRGFFRAIRMEPSLLRSPLSRPTLSRPLGKAFVETIVGERGTKLLRRLASAARSLSRRDVFIRQARLERESQKNR